MASTVHITLGLSRKSLSRVHSAAANGKGICSFIITLKTLLFGAKIVLCLIRYFVARDLECC